MLAFFPVKEWLEFLYYRDLEKQHILVDVLLKDIKVVCLQVCLLV